MASIKFDGTEILNTTYIPRFIKHESPPERILNILDLPRDDGSVLISSKYGRKYIPIQGVLVGSSESDLESKIDTFKELFSRTNKNLDITFAGATRRYKASVESFSFDRDYYNISYVPWQARFVIVEGVGEDTTETAYKNEDEITPGSDGVQSAWTLAGTAPPKPRVTITPNATGADCRGVAIVNEDNSQRIMVPVSGGLASGTPIEIDFRLKTAKLAGVETEYLGQFPEMKVGVNNMRIYAGEVPLEKHAGYVDGFKHIYGSLRQAQSFRVDYSDMAYHRIFAWLQKVGSPSGAMTYSILEDDGGEPGTGTPIVTDNLAAASVSTTAGWYMIRNSLYTGLVPGVTYWLVIDANTIGDVDNFIWWGSSLNEKATYKKGNAAYYNAGWVDEPNRDMLFDIRFMGQGLGGTVDLDVDYYKRYL
jgi:hypothetical protein